MRKINNDRKKVLDELEKKLGYSFTRKYILDRAMTHSSYANEYGLSYVEHNERLEFLGDSVLSLIISEYIFKKYKNKPEGKLTKIRASIVCETSLYERARKLGLGEYLLIGKGEEVSGGRKRPSMLADAYEALIAAIYIDGGFKEAERFVIGEFLENIHNLSNEKKFKDYKSVFQEYIQKNKDSIIKYETISEEGPDHNRVFYVVVSVNNKVMGKGKGKTKKEAEQEAAKCALISMGVIN